MGKGGDRANHLAPEASPLAACRLKKLVELGHLAFTTWLYLRYKPLTAFMLAGLLQVSSDVISPCSAQPMSDQGGAAAYDVLKEPLVVLPI